jgi:hypothetical protein
MEIQVINKPLGRSINVKHERVEFIASWDVCDRHGAYIIVDVCGAGWGSEFDYGISVYSASSLASFMKRLFPAFPQFRVSEMANEVWQAALTIKPAHYSH